MDNHLSSNPTPEKSLIKLTPLALTLIIAVNALILLLLIWPRIGGWIPALHTETPTATLTLTPTPSATPLPSATSTPEPTATRPPSATPTSQWLQFYPEPGILILSLREGLDIHLFTYQPFLEPDAGFMAALPLTRLTGGIGKDIHPALSPVDPLLAFSSNRGGNWDLYLLDLESGQLRQFTDTPGYEGNPTWSPDGKWLAYERYETRNLDIFLQDLNQKNAPINLTGNPDADHSPAWSPGGRKIAFISTRTGKPEVWIADLDQQKIEERFFQVTRNGSSWNQHPAWSPDNRYLSWATITKAGVRQIVTWDRENPQLLPRPVGNGDWPIWSGSGSTLYSSVKLTDGDYLTAYPVGDPQAIQVSMPPIRMPGEIEGITWGEQLPSRNNDLSGQALVEPTPLWEMKIDVGESNPNQRYSLVDLAEVDAPYPQLHDLVDESFAALRTATREEIGWDFLGMLENAFLPLTANHEPGLEEDWLFTGRAFSVSDIPYQSDWMIVVREDIAGQTFWRVYLKTLDQTGRQGRPLKQQPWYFDPYHLSPGSYEKGGLQDSSIPAGYWVDFTSLANVFGWERLAALPSWGGAVRTTRFQEFVYREGLSWYEAMLELYPPEALITPAADSEETPTP